MARRRLYGAESARPIGASPSSAGTKSQYKSGEVRQKSGPQPDALYLVEKHHAQQAASEPELVKAAEKLGLRLTPPPE